MGTHRVVHVVVHEVQELAGIDHGTVRNGPVFERVVDTDDDERSGRVQTVEVVDDCAEFVAEVEECILNGHLQLIEVPRRIHDTADGVVTGHGEVGVSTHGGEPGVVEADLKNDHVCSGDLLLHGLTLGLHDFQIVVRVTGQRADEVLSDEVALIVVLEEDADLFGTETGRNIRSIVFTGDAELRGDDVTERTFDALVLQAVDAAAVVVRQAEAGSDAVAQHDDLFDRLPVAIVSERAQREDGDDHQDSHQSGKQFLGCFLHKASPFSNDFTFGV